MAGMFDRPGLKAALVVVIGILVAGSLNLLTGGLVGGAARWLLVAGVSLLGVLWIVLEYSGARVGKNPHWRRPIGIRMLPKLDEPIDRPALRNALVRMLVAEENVLIGITALQGAGGFGKTTLAVQACGQAEVQERFTGGLLWATVGEERRGAELASIVNDLSAQLTGERPQFSDPEQAGLHLGRLLDEHRNTLLVIDDLWTTEQYRPFSYGGSTTTRLVTTRNISCLPSTSRTLRIDEMASAESLQLVGRGLGVLPSATAEQLLQVTGNWPLLLAMVNRAIRGHVNEGVPLVEAAELLVEQLRIEGPSFLDVRIGASRDHAVRLTVAASLRLLTTRQRACYFQLGIFADDTNIPLSVLMLLWDKSAAATRQLCEDLANLSLIRAYGRGSAALQLHDVIRDHLRHELGDDLVDVNAAFLKTARSAFAISGDEWWRLPRSAEYLWRQVAYHLIEGDQMGELKRLVCNLRWGAEKIRMFGLPAFESDLIRVDDPIVNALRLALVRKGHLLGAIEPAHSHDDVLVSRLGSVPELRKMVSGFSEGMPKNVARITNLWPIPSVDPALLRVLPAHTDRTSHCGVSPDGKWLATSDTRGLRLWRTDSWVGDVVLGGLVGPVTSCAFSPDGRWLVSTGEDSMVRLWDTSSWAEVAVLRGCGVPLTGCAWSSDSRWMAICGANGVQVWRTGDWVEQVRLEDHVGLVTSCVFSPDDEWLVSTGYDGAVRVWNTTRPGCKVLHSGAAPVLGGAFSPDGAWLATHADEGVRLWRTGTWQGDVVLKGHAGPVSACVFSPDGTRLVTVGVDRTIRVWETSSWTEKIVMRGHTEMITGCAFAPDQRWLVSTGGDQSVRVWDVSANRELGGRYEQNRSVEHCLVSPDGTWVVSAGDDGVVCAWTTYPPVERRVVAVYFGAVICCGLSPDGVHLVTIGSDGAMDLWNTVTWTGSPLELAGAGRVKSCAFSPDGTMVVTVSHDGMLRAWQNRTWVLLAAVGSQLDRCVFSPDGVWLVTGDGSGRITVWNTRTWVAEAEWHGHSGPITGSAFSPDSAWLATTGVDRSVRVWRTTDWAEATRLASGMTVSGCAFSVDGSWLAVTGEEGTVQVWESVTWQLVAAMRTNGRANAVEWHPDSRAMCVGSSGGLYQFLFTPPAV